MAIGVLLCLLLFISPAHAAYKRVISLAPSATEMIYAVGGEDALVGVTDYCDYPEAATEKESVGSYMTPSFEKIVSLAPDCVIVPKAMGSRAIATKLAQVGISLEIVQFYSLADIVRSYRAIGAVIGKTAEADRAAAAFERECETYRGAEEGSRPTVLFVRWHAPLSVAGEGSLENEILTLIGAENCARNGKGRYPAFTLEAIMADPPDVIIDGSYFMGDPTPAQIDDARRFWSAWPQVPAVRNKRVYVFHSDFHSVPGPRTAVFVREVAAMVHPERFTPVGGLSEAIDC